MANFIHGAILYALFGCSGTPDNIELKDLDNNRKEVLKYHEDGSIALKGYLKDGVAVGKWEEWYGSGQKKAEYSFLDGLEQGQRTTWYPSGQLAEQGEMRFGDQEGTWKMWYESGLPMAETSYKKGVESGERTHWYKSGKKKSQATVLGGLQNGLRIFWYETGQIKARGYFKTDLKQVPEEFFSDDCVWRKTVCFDADVEQKIWTDKQPEFSEMLCTMRDK